MKNTTIVLVSSGCFGVADRLTSIGHDVIVVDKVEESPFSNHVPFRIHAREIDELSSFNIKSGQQKRRENRKSKRK